MRSLLNKIHHLEKNKEAFVLATIVEHSGSTPRSSGTRMVIRKNGEIIGTIGGGLLEATIRSRAKSIFETKLPHIEKIAFSGEDAAQSEMICGGEVTVLLEWIDPDDNYGRQLILNIQKDMDVQGRALIFGAGHVSQALAEVLQLVGFYTIIIDDRREYANSARFPKADEILTLEPIQSIIDKLLVDENNYIIIVTRGHLFDREVLQKALETSAGYIGMIGSNRKCRLIFDYLLNNGFREEDLARVHAPIGIRIAAETPEEIAVSIAAEMIQARAAKNA